ncbi:MAG: hypothetical protein ABIM50_05105 [Novosphingobium sp.]
MTARISRLLALALALLIVALMIWAIMLPAPPVVAAKESSSYNDINLYQDVAAAVAQGKSYYPAAADLHRAHGYPLQPFLVVRLPTMAYAAALLGWPVLRGIALLLLIAGGLIWFATLRSLHTRGEQLAALVFAVMLGGGMVASPQLVFMHEGWVGLLLFPALPLLWRWPSRWPIAFLLAAVALALRELALPFVLLAGANSPAVRAACRGKRACPARLATGGGLDRACRAVRRRHGLAPRAGSRRYPPR